MHSPYQCNIRHQKRNAISTTATSHSHTVNLLHCLTAVLFPASRAAYPIYKPLALLHTPVIFYSNTLRCAWYLQKKRSGRSTTACRAKSGLRLASGGEGQVVHLQQDTTWQSKKCNFKGNGAIYINQCKLFFTFCSTLNVIVQKRL